MAQILYLQNLNVAREDNPIQLETTGKVNFQLRYSCCSRNDVPIVPGRMAPIFPTLTGLEKKQGWFNLVVLLKGKGP